MKGLTITKRVSLSLSADDWELYTATPKLAEACREAAEELNRTIEETVNAGGDRKQVWAALEPVTRRHEEVGARDSEPLRMIQHVIDEIFGRP